MRYPTIHGAVLAALCAAAPAFGAGCTVSSPGLAFGPYQPLTFGGRLSSTAVTSDASVSVACTGITTGGAYTISLGPSIAGSGDRIGTRYMGNASGGPDMAFNVYLDPNYTVVWGDGMIAGSVISGSIPPGDSNQSHTVYGRIPGGQNTLTPGTYAGALTITISYNP